MKRWQIIIFCTLLALLALSVFVNVMLLLQRNTTPKEVVADTARVTLIDTVPYYEPVPKDSFVVRYIKERLPIANDTMQEHIADISNIVDSVEVQLPIEQKRYADSTYTAWVSGYHPTLDSIFVYPRHEVMTITNTIRQKPKRWGVGLNVGYGITQKNGMQPYIGIGVQYNLFSF